MIMEELANLNNGHGHPLYTIEWDVLNPRIHAGVPQNRPRLFIIGIRNDVKRSRFGIPCRGGDVGHGRLRGS